MSSFAVVLYVLALAFAGMLTFVYVFFYVIVALFHLTLWWGRVWRACRSPILSVFGTSVVIGGLGFLAGGVEGGLFASFMTIILGLFIAVLAHDVGSGIVIMDGGTPPPPNWSVPKPVVKSRWSWSGYQVDVGPDEDCMRRKQ